MRTQLSLLTIAAAIALVTAPAFAADTPSAKTEIKTEQDANGNFKQDVAKEATDAAGTKTSTEAKTSVDVDAKGNVEKKAVVEKSVDPKGLMNKQTTKVEDVAKDKDGKMVRKHTKTVNGKTVEDKEVKSDAKTDGTKTETKTETSTDVNVK